jgi:integrase
VDDVNAVSEVIPRAARLSALPLLTCLFLPPHPKNLNQTHPFPMTKSLTFSEQLTMWRPFPTLQEALATVARNPLTSPSSPQCHWRSLPTSTFISPTPSRNLHTLTSAHDAPPSPSLPLSLSLPQPTTHSHRDGYGFDGLEDPLTSVRRAWHQSPQVRGPTAPALDPVRRLRNAPALATQLPLGFPAEATTALQCMRSGTSGRWRQTMTRLLKDYERYRASLDDDAQRLPHDLLVTWFLSRDPHLQAPTRQNYLHAMSRGLQETGLISSPLHSQPHSRAWLAGLHRLWGMTPMTSAEAFTPADLRTWLALTPPPPDDILTAVAIAFLGGRRLADLCGRVRADEVNLQGEELVITFPWLKQTLGTTAPRTWIRLPPELTAPMQRMLATTQDDDVLWDFLPDHAATYLHRMRSSLSCRSMRVGAATTLIQTPGVKVSDVMTLTGHRSIHSLAHYTRRATPMSLRQTSMSLSRLLQ